MAEQYVGCPSPLGALVEPDGVNFSVYSRNAERVDLLLYDHVDDAEPAQVLKLTPDPHRTYHYWHVFAAGIGPGQVYAYHAHGPYAPDQGHRFNADKVLLDPYGRAVATPSGYDRRAAIEPGRNDAAAFKSVVADLSTYDWEGDLPLRRPFAGSVIYEMHVGGFTKHPNSGVDPERRGTFAGLIEKIPYLQDLGVTAVELMPVFQFDSEDVAHNLTNYWGYAPISFFAPHAAYSSRRDALGPLDEFRDMVKALHRAGIEVFLDVVYNHTAEAGAHGATMSFRGLENSTYYILENGGRDFANYSGCGNTLNANQSIVRRLILDSLHFWVGEMHVDGFRFDLASILSRDQSGHPLPNPPVLWDIESDPHLAGTKLIAEAWDAAGLYQVGDFAGDNWKEWNGQFRDDVRAFVRGDAGTVERIADRLVGSPDMYADEPREAEQSINFVTSHDGFTANDLVSYNRKHNAANLEGGRDGTNHNVSWNCGVEGPTADPAIESLRNRQVKNLLTITMMSLGAPMLLMGDEVRRTQLGNNNAYCQDNEISWFDWDDLARHADMHRFVRGLIELRRQRDSVTSEPHLTLTDLMERANIEFHGVRVGDPDFSHHSRSIALSAQSLPGDLLMLFALNSYWAPLEFELPPLPAWATSGWRRVVDTALAPPDDVSSTRDAPVIAASSYRIGARSVAVFIADATPAD